MSYPTQPAQAPAATTAPPKSARAASKAPVGYAAAATTTTTTAAATPGQGQGQQPQAHQHGQQGHRHPSPPSSNASGVPQKRGTTAGKGKASANKIWSTSSTEERERIKEFWLGLSEDERRNLVKVEKEAVLQKMKEQQKHSCGCAVCGRKRSVLLPPLDPLFPFLFCSLVF